MLLAAPQLEAQVVLTWNCLYSGATVLRMHWCCARGGARPTPSWVLQQLQRPRACTAVDEDTKRPAERQPCNRPACGLVSLVSRGHLLGETACRPPLQVTSSLAFTRPLESDLAASQKLRLLRRTPPPRAPHLGQPSAPPSFLIITALFPTPPPLPGGAAAAMAPKGKGPRRPPPSADQMAARLDRAAGERMFFMGRVASPAARDNGGGEADGDGDGSGCGGNGAPGVLAPFVVTGLSGSVYTIHLSTEEAGPSAADAGGVGIVAKCNCRDYIFRRVGDVGARKLRCGRGGCPGCLVSQSCGARRSALCIAGGCGLRGLPAGH